MTAEAIKEQLKVIRRGAVQLVSEEELAEKLTAAAARRRPLRIKYGADPSAPDLHLGHTIPLFKLREFQDLGHLVVFIIGDFTAMVGDPSGVSRTRPRLSREEVERNARTYQDQVFKILREDRTEVVFNSRWLSPLDFAGVINLASRVTVARMLERDDFAGRYRDGEPISVLEFLYPLMQGYDSVMVESDVEIGGTDQTFNLLLAREIQRSYGQPPQAILTLPLLEGTDGVRKMSKSLGNYIGITEDPVDIYGKVMSIPDELMWRYFELLNLDSAPRIEKRRRECREGRNPMEFKHQLAGRITELFSSPESARKARERFNRVCRDRGAPLLEDMETVEIRPSELKEGRIDIVSLLRVSGLAASNSEARRKLAEGAVSLNAEKIIEHTARVAVKDDDVLRLGKRGFKRLILTGKKKLKRGLDRL